jgi:endo-1,4-beta-xylanase
MRSGLKVGTAVAMDLYGSDPAYTRIVDRQFNTVTAENVMKWQLVEPTQGTYDWAAADRLVAGARANHQLVRGHTLVWHNQLPNWLSSSSFTPQQVRDLLHKHVVDEVTHFRGQIWQWDVVNEAFNDDGTPRQDIFYQAYQALGLNGLDYVADAFRWAHEADPHALLFYNDYNIGGEDGTNAKFKAAYALAQSLQKNSHIDGIGIQGHLDTQYGWSPERLRQDIESFASLGLKVAITEADVRTFVNNATDQAPTDKLAPFAQAYEYSEMLKAALAVPELISFTVWGFTDSDSWVPGTFSGEGYAGIYDVNQNPKPSYYALQSNLALAAYGAPRRVRTYSPRA